MRVNFYKGSLAATKQLRQKTMNAYIICDFDAWPNNPLNNFNLKHSLFGATNKVEKVIKKSGCIVAMEQHLMEQVHGILVMTLLKML